jgi:hypothetical protein
LEEGENAFAGEGVRVVGTAEMMENISLVWEKCKTLQGKLLALVDGLWGLRKALEGCIGEVQCFI